MKKIYRNGSRAKRRDPDITNRTAHRTRAADIREHLTYDPETGEFFHSIRKLGTKLGSRAGRVNAQGYIDITINRQTYKAHRLAWFFVHGEWPKELIDHKNGIRTDNRITNLRDVSQSVNMQNRKKAQANSLSGFLGVRPHKKKWQAVITINGKSVPLGTYDTPEEAQQVYLTKKREVHPGCTI